jgi:hypothetical protein
MKSPADLAVRLAWAVRRDPDALESRSLWTAARLLTATASPDQYHVTDATRRAALRLAVAAVAVAAGVGSTAAARAALAELEAAARPRLSVVH